MKATELLVMRAIEDRLATLDELIAAVKARVEGDDARTDEIARRFFMLEHRMALLEEAAEYWGLRKARGAEP